jgi:hypothetical protein
MTMLQQKAAFKRMCVFTGLCLLAPSAMAATTSSTVRTTIVQPVSMTKTSDLAFGRVISRTTANRITINQTTGVRTASLGATTLLAGAPISRAAFQVVGQPAMITTVALPASTVLARTGGGASMTVNTYRRRPTGNPVIPASGAYTLNVGARLNVSANQQPGVYTGSFTVTVNYQ